LDSDLAQALEWDLDLAQVPGLDPAQAVELDLDPA